IHQAKGLEFPVVFLPDIGHTIRQVSDRILFDESKGLALRLYQDSKGTYQSTMVYEEIRKLHNKREYAESKRLFYVAATRARDYLVLSGEKPKRVGSACWRVWLDQFLELHPDELVCVVQEEDISEVTPNEVKNLYQRDQGYQKLGEVKVEKDGSSQELAGNILQQSCFRRESSVEEFSITVTALSEYMVCPQRFYYTQYLGLDEKAVSEIRGNDKLFSKGRDETVHSLSKLEKGNLVHLILKHINFQLDTEKKSKEIDGMLFSQGVSSRSDDVEELRSNILAFLNSDLGITLSKIREEHSFREIPFMLKLQEHDSSFTVVVQGVIDLLYRDFEGVWTVVDYKYSPGRIIDRERYKIQLMAYALSVSKIMKEDKVNVIIKVMEKKDMSPQEWCLEEIDLKNFEQQVIAATQEIAKKQMMSDPVLWTRKESADCKSLDCVYWKRCNA
ncbi:MAG: PD-(D/E)XK nuclease family protein, partial [Deltaproteobacteria bacterium]|nr:PD-(D/E)XK nuclease family protein [Deltaproteobacteria bacterium]